MKWSEKRKYKNIDNENGKKLYFNKHEFEKIFELSKEDPIKSLEEYKEYISKYPEDNAAKAYYITNLLAVRKYEEAEEKIKELEIELSRNSIYHYEEERANILSFNIKLCKLKLLLFQGKKEEAVEFFYNNFDDLSNLGEEVLLYFKKLIGQTDTKGIKCKSYIIRQTIDYQEEEFRDHIKKHLADYNENDRRISKTYFNPDFPIDEIIDEVKKYIPSNKGVRFGYVDDSYIFRYDLCGRYNNRLVDYFKVITFLNSQEFITMCPVEGTFNEELVIDLNDFRKQVENETNSSQKEEGKSLAKVPSRIDKFNKRYNR